MTISGRVRILEAAFTVLAATPGASLADIAQAAGVGRATLHRHFEGRRDLLEAMAHAATEQIETITGAAAANAQSHGEGLRLCLEALTPLADRLWFLASEPLERIPSVAAAYKAQREALAKEIEAAKGEGVFAQDVPTGWIVESFDALIYAAWRQVKEGELTPRQAAALAWRNLTQGLGPPS